MKHLSKKILLLLLAAAAILTMVVTAAAFHWDLKVGETFSLQLSKTPYVSSDPSVVEIRQEGDYTYVAVAVGKGTATVSGGSWMGNAQEEYSFTVKEKAKNEPAKNDFYDFDEPDTSDSGFSSLFSGGLAVFGIFFAIVFTLIILIVIWLVATLKKSRKLDSAMQAILSNPCQQTAEAAVAEFSQMHPLIRLNLANGSDTRGVHFTMWREVFRYTVLPCRAIKPETKEALRRALVHLNTYGLDTPVHTQTAEEGKAAAEAFGAGGEAHVWHNLRSLEGCDVYRNVRIRNGNTSSEIDAVIVDAAKGIFLIETKSVGGTRDASGSKVIDYNLLKEDPSNQIYRHEADFKAYFADFGIGSKIKNVLVFSWPYGDDRRFLAKGTFPRTDYAIITVEQLMGHHRAQPEVTLSADQRTALAEKLKRCCSEYIIR